MKNFYACRVWAGLAALSFVVSSASSVQADLNILSIGDSLTSGKNPASGAPARASYRPFLWNTIDNFLNTGNNNPAGISVDMIGLNSGPSQPPAGTPPFDPDHQSAAGLSTQSFSSPASGAFIGTALGTLESAGDVPDLALVLLGSNDLFVNVGGGVNRSDPLGASGGVGVVGDIAAMVNILKNGYVDPNNNTIALGNPDIEVLLGAIPPVDHRRLYNPNDANSSGFLWTENERGEDVDQDGKFDKNTNDVIDLINLELFKWASATDGVTFVDTLAPTYLVDADGDNVPVKPDGNNDPQMFDVPADPFLDQSDDLLDGVHLSAIGDQIFAGNWWDGGVRAFVSGKASVVAVPEPSSFMFLGLVGALIAAIRFAKKVPTR